MMNDNQSNINTKAKFHLPGLFEFYEFYKVFLKVFHEHREYFYDWVEIESIYGAPPDCIWGGGRMECSDAQVTDVIKLLNEYGISGRLTFSNSLLREEHLTDKKSGRLCELFEKSGGVKNGVIVHSELLLSYLKERYPGLYFVSSTTKVLTDFDDFLAEVRRAEFDYVVPDFRLNNKFDYLNKLSQTEKDKTEFLCNECCYVGCTDRKACYENVSRRVLGIECEEHVCKSPGGNEGYVFSKAMKSSAFIGIEDIKNKYLPAGFSNFKIEGRSLGSAILLEFLLYYMTKAEYQLQVREKIYLSSMLDLF